MYSIRGDGRRICETSLRKYAQLNFSTPMVSSSSSSSPSSPSPLSPAPGPPPPPPPLRAVPFVNHPRFPAPPARPSPPRPSYVGPHLLRRPRILRPACCLAPLRSLFFSSQRTFSVSPLSPLHSEPGSISFILRRHPRPRSPLSPLPPPCPPPPQSSLALLSRRPCSRAVPLYLPPPVVPSSLKAVESNR